MRTSQFFLMTVLMLCFLVSCNKKSGGNSGGGGEEQREEDSTGGKINLTIDSDMTASEINKLNESISLIENLQIDGSRIKGFTEMFGGPSSSNVADYFASRVTYVISQNTDFQSRLVLAEFPNSLDYFAANPSVFIWYISLVNEPQDVRFLINNNPVDIPSTRIGVMQLGDIFTTSDAITDAITLVHEARHSDCPEGALASEILRVMNGQPPINHTCGQLHAGGPECDNGSSCDVIPWGPYAADFIYSLAIFTTCSSCSETEKQQALVNANMVQSAAFDIEPTVNGAHGPPNMSNSNQVRDDL